MLRTFLEAGKRALIRFHRATAFMKSSFRRSASSLAALTAILLGTVSCGSTMSIEPDAGWATSTIRFGSIDISIAIPPNERRDYPPVSVSEYVETTDGRFDRPVYSVSVLKKWWGNRVPMRVKCSGTLALQVRIFRRPPDFEGNILSSSELGALKVQLIEASGSLVATVNSPKVDSERTWSRIDVRGDSDMRIYVTALSDDHYLQVQAAFIDNTRGGRDVWREAY